MTKEETKTKNESYPHPQGTAGYPKAGNTQKGYSSQKVPGVGHGRITILAMAEMNTSRTEKTPTAVLCTRERTILRDRRCRALGKSCSSSKTHGEVRNRISEGRRPAKNKVQKEAWPPPPFPMGIPSFTNSLREVPLLTEPQEHTAQINTVTSNSRKILA